MMYAIPAIDLLTLEEMAEAWLIRARSESGPLEAESLVKQFEKVWKLGYEQRQAEVNAMLAEGILVVRP